MSHWSRSNTHSPPEFTQRLSISGVQRTNGAQSCRAPGISQNVSTPSVQNRCNPLPRYRAAPIIQRLTGQSSVLCGIIGSLSRREVIEEVRRSKDGDAGAGREMPQVAGDEDGVGGDGDFEKGDVVDVGKRNDARPRATARDRSLMNFMISTDFQAGIPNSAHVSTVSCSNRILPSTHTRKAPRSAILVPPCIRRAGGHTDSDGA